MSFPPAFSMVHHTCSIPLGHVPVVHTSFSILRLLVFRSLAHFPPRVQCPSSGLEKLVYHSWATVGPASILIAAAHVDFGSFLWGLEGVGGCALVLDMQGVSIRPSRYCFFQPIYLIHLQ